MSKNTAAGVLAIVGTAAAINAVDLGRRGRVSEGVGVLFGGAALFGSLAAIGQFYDWRVARALALLVLMGTLVLRGEGVANWLSDAVSSFQSAPKKSSKITKPSNRK